MVPEVFKIYQNWSKDWSQNNISAKMTLKWTIRRQSSETLAQILIKQSNSTISGGHLSGQHIFSKIGNIALTKGNHVWSTFDWSDVFKVEFDVIVNKDMPGISHDMTWKSLFHVTTGGNIGEGGRIPAVFVNAGGKYFYICYIVSGDTNYCHDFTYELNRGYHFEIAQQKRSTGEAVYSVNVNGETIHKKVNNMPRKYKNVKLYLSDPWHDTFAGFGELSNLKIIPNLSLLGKCIFDFHSAGIHLFIG